MRENQSKMERGIRTWGFNVLEVAHRGCRSVSSTLLLMTVISTPSAVFVSAVVLPSGNHVVSSLADSRFDSFGAAYVQYNPSGSQHTLKVVSLDGSSSTLTIPGTAGGTGTTGVQWPIGSAHTTFSVTNPSFFNQRLGTWLVTLPSDGSTGTTSTYVFTSSLSQPTFLSQQNNAALWMNEAGSLGGENPFVLKQNFTSTVSAPTSCSAGAKASTSNVCEVSWYIYRFYVTVDMAIAGASLSVSCYDSCQSVSCLFGYLCNTEPYQRAFQSGVQSALSTAINPVAHLSNPTILSLQLNVPAFAVQSNLDWYGIVMAATANPSGAGGGIQVGDLLETGCGSPAACTIVQTNIHTSLGLWKDSALTQPALPFFSSQLNIKNYTASQLSQLIPSSISSTVYTKIDVSDFGAGFVMDPACFITNYTTCFQTASPQATLTILYDVLGSKTAFYEYPTPPAQVGTNAGSMDGQVIDGSLPWHPGIAGASICFVDITGCTAADSNGNFLFANIAAGQHTVQVAAPDFISDAKISVDIGTGTTTHMGQISLSPQNPWYSGKLCIGGNPTSPGLCIPYPLIFGIIAAVIAVIVIVAFIYRPKIPRLYS